MRFGAIILPSLFISLTGFAKSMRVENRSVRPVNSDLYSMKGEVSTAGANELYQTASSRYRYTALALSSGGKVECVSALQVNCDAFNKLGAFTWIKASWPHRVCAGQNDGSVYCGDLSDSYKQNPVLKKMKFRASSARQVDIERPYISFIVDGRIIVDESYWPNDWTFPRIGWVDGENSAANIQKRRDIYQEQAIFFDKNFGDITDAKGILTRAGVTCVFGVRNFRCKNDWYSGGDSRQPYDLNVVDSDIILAQLDETYKICLQTISNKISCWKSPTNLDSLEFLGARSLVK